MFTAINYSAEQAREDASSGTSRRIPANSGELVKITRAEFKNAQQSKAQAIEFDFINKNNQTATTSVWYRGKEGEESPYGMNRLHGIMGAAGVQSITPTVMTVPKFDFEKKKTIQVSSPNAQELVGKYLTIVLNEAPEYYNGKIRERKELFAVFDRKGKSFREREDGNDYEDLNRACEAAQVLGDKRRAGLSKAAASYTSKGAPDTGGYSLPQQDFDDDGIPF